MLNKVKHLAVTALCCGEMLHFVQHDMGLRGVSLHHDANGGTSYFWIGLALPNTGFGPATGAAQREALAITRLISGLK